MNELLENKKMYGGLVFIFIMTFLIGCLTPYHSDDFSYYFQGFDFVKHYRHYMGWSGRLAADWTSGALLVTGCHGFIIAVQAMVLTGYCYMVASMPSRVMNKSMAWFMPLIIFVAYWVSNVNLGQTTFWIVGSANYLFTNFYILCFLTYYYNHYAETDWKVVAKGFLLALVAGCTNENTSVMLVCVMVANIVLLKWQKDDFQLKSACVYLVGVVIGTLVLLLAPGNYKRASHPAFAKWKALTWGQKINKHFQSFPWLTNDFFPIYLGILIEYLVVFVSRKFKDNQVNILWSSVYLLAAIGSVCVMAAAPGMAPRTYNGPMTYLLIAFSFALYFDGENCVVKRLALSQIVLYFSYLFVPSYVCVFSSYKVALVQNDLREETIEYCKSKGINTLTVPGYYFPRLMKNRDMYDMYHSGAMGKFYGMKKINKVNVNYDYSLLREGKKIGKESVNSSVGDVDLLTADSKFIINKGRVLLVFNDAKMLNQNVNLIVKEKKTGKKWTYKLSPCVMIAGKYCTGITLWDKFRAQKYIYEIRR